MDEAAEGNGSAIVRKSSREEVWVKVPGAAPRGGVAFLSRWRFKVCDAVWDLFQSSNDCMPMTRTGRKSEHDAATSLVLAHQHRACRTQCADDSDGISGQARVVSIQRSARNTARQRNHVSLVNIAIQEKHWQ